VSQPQNDPQTAAAVVADMQTVTFIYDTALGSPIETQALGGKEYGLPPSAFPLPRRGTLLGQAGFGRQATVADPVNPGSTMVRWEWVLQGGTDPVDTFVDNLTGKGGWTVPGSRATVKLMIQRLFSAGIPRSTIASQIPQFYNAVAAEVRAEDALPPSP
jgi:hypothetical protein